MSCSLGYVAPQDLKVGGNAFSHRTACLLLGLLRPLNRLLGEVGREKEEKGEAWLPDSSSSRSGPASNKRWSGRNGIVDPAPGSPGGSAAPGT